MKPASRDGSNRKPSNLKRDAVNLASPTGAVTGGSAARSAKSTGGRGRRLTTRLVALSATAILSVYAAGFARTQAAENLIATQSQASQATGAVALSALVTPTATAAARNQSLLRDGTYTGNGYSRHGGVTSKVVIQGGQIVSAAITSCSTRFPCSAIASLPDQVVAQQGPPVDLVSGATDSSQAYVGAIQDALTQAA